MSTKPKAVILLSGGLDSTTCLAMALAHGYDCYALSIDYGQRHRAELNAARRVANSFAVAAHKIIPLDLSCIGGSALTDTTMAVTDYDGSTVIPATYVPARNTLFFSLALGYAEVLGAHVIYTGINAVDYSHYPDCRPEYLERFQIMANYATKAGIENHPIRFAAPLLYLTKAEIIKAGLALNVDYRMTVSCYRADAQGLACGTCDSCVLRQRGFAQAGVADMTHYQKH